MVAKDTYYVDISSGDVVPHAEEARSVSFQIKATPEEVSKLKALFQANDEDDMSTFNRAQIPFRQYHNDPENTRYDHSMQKIYSMIHQLGTLETRRNIEEMGVLNPTHQSNSRKDIENLK
ncbi:hypothetical protein LCM10_20355 [Rossellomorea aquimaris]|uniref:hypothetical protein n=1 Tax=Rossellomorea aquimaris TaxID=189382 RepID=UPI001CD77E6E|nr:hypothetical protein [Rossellomorea aquimaris]MCA1057299.1 hypothetical protein [Rossellomorea aquimaris]